MTTNTIVDIPADLKSAFFQAETIIWGLGLIKEPINVFFNKKEDFDLFGPTFRKGPLFFKAHYVPGQFERLLIGVPPTSKIR